MVALVLASAVLGAMGELLRLPASLLLGPLFAAVGMAASGRAVAVGRTPLAVAQAVIGCLMARALPFAIFARLAQHWLVSGGAILSVVAASAGGGLLLARLRVLPGTTAIWGSMPGAASVMVLMSAAGGADPRLVAIMQYLRVVTVAVAASMVAALVGAKAASHGFGILAPIHAGPLAKTLVLVAAAAAIGTRVRLPAGPLLVALGAGTALHDAGVVAIELPPLLLVASYAVLGWSFGQRFTPDILRRALAALPSLLATTAAMVATCALLAVVLARVARVDLLTAYLATSPGGADSIAIIATASHVDLPFVMAIQAGRFLFVLAAGPLIARVLAGRIAEASPR